MTKSRDSKILIVGGAGFIGSHVNLLLNRNGYETVVFDNLSTGSKNAVICGTFVQGDLKNTSDLNQLFQKYNIDSVLHFAGSANVRESVADPGTYFQNNVTNSLNLLKAMTDHGVQHLIFSSSAAVYGHPKTESITEEDPTEPVNPYGETKLAFERILPWFEQAHHIRFSLLRYFNAAGGDPEGELKQWNPDDFHLIPMTLKSIYQNQPLIINGTDYPTPDGTCIRDYIHVSDLATAHIIALEKLLSGAPSSCYNLGIGKGFSVQEVIQAAEEVIGQPISIQLGPRRAGDPPSLVASAEKANNALNWSPKYVSLEPMIAHAHNAILHLFEEVPV